MKKKNGACQTTLKRNLNNKIILSLLISFMVTSAAIPIVLAASTDTLEIYFDPNADIDIDVSHSSYNFTSVLSNAWSNTSGNYFILYNNGTIAMDTDIMADNVTTEGMMRLNQSTSGPQQDEYAVYVMDLEFPGYVNDSYSAFNEHFDTDLAPNANKVFDIGLLIGLNISANHTYQAFTITFRGTEFTP